MNSLARSGRWMQDARTWLAPSERAAVERAIAEVEQGTAAEVVCAVATESGRYDRAESLAGIALATLLTGLAGWLDLGGSPGGHAGWLVLAVLGGFFGGASLASYWHGLRRVFTSRGEMAAEVDRAASQVFLLGGLGTTGARAGLLVYVSLYEGRVAVRADRALLDAVGQRFLDALAQAAVRELRMGRRAEALTTPLARAARELAAALPRTGTEHGLPNDLLVFHPRP